MKKIQVLLLLFLTSCSHASASTASPIITVLPVPEYLTPTPNSNAIQPMPVEYRASIEAFKTSGECPNICWLGIHPGVTSATHAVQILNDLNDVTLIKLSDSSINAGWFTSNVKENPLPVNIEILNGVVKSIHFVLMYPFTVNDFVNLLGEPEQLQIEVVDSPDGKWINYTLYYSTLNSLLYIRSSGKDGPAPKDYIYEMTVNISPGTDEHFQLWLGYGHLQDYLQKVMPTFTP